MPSRPGKESAQQQHFRLCIEVVRLICPDTFLAIVVPRCVCQVCLSKEVQRKSFYVKASLIRLTVTNAHGIHTY